MMKKVQLDIKAPYFAPECETLAMQEKCGICIIGSDGLYDFDGGDDTIDDSQNWG